MVFATLAAQLPFDLEALRLDVLLRLAVAALLGGAIGFEREARRKEAGLRTHILIAVGAALFTILSVDIAAPYTDAAIGDVTRIAANVVTGIGFIGAGVIMQSQGRVHGLTTAATIWVVSALGVAAGAGAFVPAVGATVLVLFVLIPLGWWERRYGPDPPDHD